MSNFPSKRDEVTRAARELALPESRFRILSKQDAAPILARIEAHFVERAGLRWWWEAFRDNVQTSVHFRDGSGWSHIEKIVPPDSGILWFIVENDPVFVLCEGAADAIQAVIGECYGYEYYLASKNLDWLIGENHSDVVFAVGEPVAERLAVERFVSEGLHQAIRHRNLQAVKTLLDSGADIHAPDKRGWSPLARAIERGQPAIAHLLLERGADIHTWDRKGRQPLLWAAQYGPDDIAEELLNRGADAAAVDVYGKTPLRQAIRFGRTAIVKMLLERDPWPKWDVHWGWKKDFFQAVDDRRHGVVEVFLQEGRDVDCTFHSWRDGAANEATALMKAATAGDLLLAASLLRHGADVRKRLLRRSALTEALEHHGEQAPITQMLLAHGAHIGLEAAVVAGDLVMAERCLAQGAHPELPDADGQTLLVWAASHRRPDMVRLLTRFGADPTTQDRYRFNALMGAATAGDVALVSFLVEQGMDPYSDSPSRWGSPIAHAAGAGRIAVTQWFLERFGPGPDAGASALNAAAMRGSVEAVRLLLDAGVDADAHTSAWDERRALMWAADRGNMPLMHLLLERGADVNACDTRGGSAISLAASAGKLRAVRLLVERVLVAEQKNAALLGAVSTGQGKMVEFLLNAGADPNAVGHWQITALMLAARTCKPTIVAMLLNNGANTEAVDREGKTALMWAETAGRFDNAALLIR